MSEKKILFVAYLYPPVGGKGLPGVQRSVKFIRYLSGMEKYVLTLREELYQEFFSLDNKVPLPINQEKVIRTGAIDIFKVLLKGRELAASVLRKEAKPEEPQAETQTATVPAPPGEKSLFGSIKDFVSDILTIPDYAHAWIIPAIWRGTKLVGRNDVIFATGMPWTSLLVGWAIKLLTGAKLIIDFRDPWEGNLFASDKVILRKAIERFLERSIVAGADIVSLNTEDLKADFISKYASLPESKFIALPNGFDGSDFSQVPVETSRENADEILLTHAGYLYGVRDPKPILKAIRKIGEKSPDTARKIRFRQMGYTDLDYDINAFTAENDLHENYTDLGPLPFDECLRNMGMADILVIIQQDTKTQVPSKIYEYMYLKKPILTVAQKDGALGKMIEKYQFGDIFEPHDINGLADYLSRKISDKEKNGTLETVYKNGEIFDVRNITKELEKIILA